MLNLDRFAESNQPVRDNEKALRVMPPRDATSAERAQAWGRWLDPELVKRGMRNVDLQTALEDVGAHGYSAATISEWRKGKSAPSETACMEVARALHLRLPEVLRHGGFPGAASVIETEIPGEDPRLTRIRAAGLSEQQSAALEDELRARIADLDDLIEVKLARLGVQRAPEEPETNGGGKERGAS